METKKCSKCREEKPLAEFGKNKKAPNEIHYICKKCNTLQSLEYIRNNSETWTPKHEEWVRSTVSGRAYVLLKAARNRAKKKGIPFTLDREWLIEKLENGVCEVTGSPLNIGYENPFTPSLDQINPSEGYTPENTRLVCWMYNTAKNRWTDDDVLNMARALLKKRGELQ